ncbi:unnamed protein product [Blepharisma stoltei]|uniref:Uncharacterized protein n=1 Tax=Blepharisma stoltei TaxID=1481888 RepID=A0AAU9JHU1_9CILI|nr:unnamed protein product [Blepharisma stoltei]
MAAVMSTKLLKEAFFQNLKGTGGSDSGSKVNIPSEDPIEVYNHAIKQFNAKCNRTNENGHYEKLTNNWFYKAWMLRWFTRIRADSNCLFLVLSFLASFAIGIIPYLNIIDFTIWFIILLFYEKQRKIHNLNAKISKNPFQYMIFDPEICRQAGLMNAYYELPISALSTVGLKEAQIQMLKGRAGKSGVVIFMVYNDKFRRAYSNFGWLRYFNIVHMIVIVGGIIFANFWLFPKLGISEFAGTGV